MRPSTAATRAAAELWKFCFARGGGTHTEPIADLLDPHDRRRRSHRLAGTRHTVTTPMITTARRSPGASAKARRAVATPPAMERPVPACPPSGTWRHSRRARRSG